MVALAQRSEDRIRFRVVRAITRVECVAVIIFFYLIEFTAL